MGMNMRIDPCSLGRRKASRRISFFLCALLQAASLIVVQCSKARGSPELHKARESLDLHSFLDLHRK